MTTMTKKEVFKEYLDEYLKANKERKGEILKHVCFVAKMHRKAAIRKFKNMQVGDPCKTEGRGRNRFYTNDVTVALEEIWRMSGRICAPLLHPIIGEYVESLTRKKRWKHSDEVTDKILFMSESTVKRRISNFEEYIQKKKSFGTTKPSLIKTIVPVFTGPWEGVKIGQGQIDTVVHCGATLFGDYAYTCNYIDVKSLWVRPRAQWNKGQEATCKSMEYIKKNLPFPWTGSHSDSGNEFINNLVVPWCIKNGIEPTRSRPNHKNDNAYIEERNCHVVRKYVGYGRFDCMETVGALNELYDVLSVYLNHFIPVRRCIEKIKINSKYKRKFEKKAMTPFQRIMIDKNVSKNVKEKLKVEHEKLDPLSLHEEVERLRKKVYDVQKRYGKSKNE